MCKTGPYSVKALIFLLNFELKDKIIFTDKFNLNSVQYANSLALNNSYTNFKKKLWTMAIDRI